MRYTVGGVFRLRSYHGNDGRTAFVPLTLRLTVIVCIFYATSTVVLAALENLRPGGSRDFSITAMLVISIMHFLVPLLISTSIVTDRPVSRPLLVLFSAAITYRVLDGYGISLGNIDRHIATVTTMFSFFLCVIWWLYASQRVAFYFSTISGASIPQELLEQRESLGRPTQLEKKMSVAASYMVSYLEYIAVAITLAMAILVFRWLSSPGY